MKFVQVYKVPNGKMVKVHVEADNVIKHIEIHGDFFLHPEEDITKLESSLKGLLVNKKKPYYCEVLEQAIASHNLQLLGVSCDDISEALVQGFALHGGKQ